MSRRARHQSDDSVTLFPFLAVLICTMGSLIVLLVVVVQQAQSEPTVESSGTPESSETPTPTPPAAPAVDLAEQQRAAELANEEHEELTWQADALRLSREKTLRRVKQQQQVLSRLEDHARGLRQRLKELEAEHQRTQQVANSDETNVAEIEAELTELAGKVELARAELERAREAAKQRRREYALVPYTGQRATKRRPIYLECLGDAIVFQPEGVKLEPDDFLPPLGPDNALASALRAAREYLLNSGAAKLSSDAYPLMVVRPSGAQGYAACRNALHGWDDEFGYELLPDDVSLAYPPPDPGLKAVLQETIELVRRRQKFMEDAMAAAGPVFAVAAGRGGFVAQPGTGTRGGTRGGTGDNQGRGPERATGATTHSDFGNSPASFGGTTAGAPGPGTGPSANQPGRQPSGESESPAKPGAWSPDGGDGTTAGPVTTGWGGNASSAADRDSAFHSSSAGTSSDPSGGSATSPPQGQAGSGGGGGGQTGGESGQQLSGGGGVSTAQATPIAATHGVNWALPNASQGAIGITRPVLVTCASDRLLIHSEVDNAAVDETVLVESTMNVAVQTFVSTIWNRIENWGIAGAGVYWKPVLKVRVAPEGEHRFAEFVQLLEASGLEVVRRP